MSLNKLFIYGALCEGHIHHGMVKNAISSQELALIRGNSYRLEVGYPVVVPGDGKVIGYLVTLNKPEISLPILDQFFQIHPTNVSESLHVRQQVEVQLGGSKELAQVYFMNSEKLPKSAELIEDGDWISDIKTKPPVIDNISTAELRYIQKVGKATGRDVVPYSSLTRDLEKRGLIVDKGRRPALTNLGREVLQFSLI